MKSLFRPFPLPQTGRQWFYILFLQGFGAGIIDGGANFAIAYAMYHSQKDIRMWVLAKNTLAGDLGVTPIIQCLASMLITSTLVHTDLHHNAVKPLPFVWPHVEHLPDPRELIDKISKKRGNHMNDGGEEEKSHESASTLPLADTTRKNGRYYLKMLIRFIFEGTEANILLSPFHPKLFFFKAFLTAAQGAAIGTVFGLPIFLIFIIVLGPIYKHDNMAETGWKWAPMVIKCVYGAMVGWITNPVIASLALGSQAERHLLVVEQVEQDEESAEFSPEGGLYSVPPIAEEDDLVPPRLPSSPHSRLDPPSTPTATNIHPRDRRRSRAASSISSRPPLVADCSDLPIIPPTSTGASTSTGSAYLLAAPRSAPLLQGDIGSRFRSSSTATVQFGTPPRTAIPYLAPSSSGPREILAPPSPRPGNKPHATPSAGRRRNLTISTARTDRTEGSSHSAAVGAVPGTPGSTWSYALGGTGGRAQRRPRGMSAASGRKMGEGLEVDARAVNTLGRVADGNAGKGGGEKEGGNVKRSAVWDVFGVVQDADVDGKQKPDETADVEDGDNNDQDKEEANTD